MFALIPNSVSKFSS